MDSPAISRSGRVLKKSAKVKEMEDIDIADLETQVKSRKKSKGMDDYDEFDDKRIAPIKIPKISLNVSPPSTLSLSPPKKKLSDSFSSMSKVPPFPSPVKSKFEANRPIFQESSPERKGSSSSETSTTSTSSSSEDDSDDYAQVRQQQQQHSVGQSKQQTIQRLPTPQEKVIVESYRQFNSPLTFVDQNSDLAMFGSEEETSESNLVIAEESSDSRDQSMKERRGSAAKRKPARKTASSRSAAASNAKARAQKRKLPVKDVRPPARKKADTAKEKKVTAYMLWCSENRKRIVSQNPVLFSSISKKMTDIWQALPEKEKMNWRRKAKKIGQKGSSIISTGRPSDPVSKPVSGPAATEDALRSSLETIKTAGTSPIDVAAYLRLLGESLSIIGQRLTEHEGQIAVSGIFSVLLDSTLCALGPLLCLTAETPELDGCSQNTLSKMLDNIAYFMPGL